MGIFDALFGNPTANTTKGYGKANKDFKRTRSVTDPFYTQTVNSGQAANSRLFDLLGLNGAAAGQTALEGIPETPGYRAGLDSGLKAIDQGAASRGMLRSGDTMKANNQFGQDYWWQTKYRPYLDDLSGLGRQGFVGAQGLQGNSEYAGQMAIGRGEAMDAGNQARAGNLLGMIGTGVSLATGMPGSLGGGQQGSYYRPYSSRSGGQAGYSPAINQLLQAGYGGLF